MPGSAILAIKIIADASQAVKELGTTGKATSEFEKGIKGLTAPAAGVAGALGAMTIAAAEDQRQTAALNKLYQNATGTTDDYSGAIEAASKAGEAKAFTDNEVRAGLKPLITATGNAEEANKLLGPAMDIARTAGVSLEVASVALAKAHEGSAAALAGLLPGLDQGASASDAIANATKLAAGAADEYAASGPGQIASVMNAYTEFAEMIGSTFLPAIAPLAGFLRDVAGFLQQQKDIVQPLAVFFGILAVAILGVSAAMGALAIVTAPVNLFILGILAIGAGLVMLYQRSQLFRDIVGAVFELAARVVQTFQNAILDLGKIAGAVFDAVGLVVRTTIDVIAAIFAGVQFMLSHPFEAFQNIAEGVFEAVQGAVGTAIDAIAFIFTTILGFLRQPFEDFQVIAETVWSAVQGYVDTAIDAITTIFSGVQEMLTGPFEAFQAVVKGVFDAVVAIAQGAVDIINGILQGIRDAIKTVSDAVDAINPLAAPPGGGAAATPRVAAFGLGRTGRSALTGGGGSTIVNLNVQSADPGEVMRAIRRWSRNNGGSGPFTRGLDRSTA